MSALQERVLHEPQMMEKLLLDLSINVTAMFRDPSFYQAFREHVVPLLRTYPFIRIWHAGCSTGEEVYSMAILLREEGLYDRVAHLRHRHQRSRAAAGEGGNFSARADAGVHRQLHRAPAESGPSPSTTRRNTAARCSISRSRRTSCSRSTIS